MAIPTTTQTLNTFIASVAENRRPGLVDNFYGSAPLWARIKSRNSVRLRGGTEIRENYVYNSFPATSYGRGDTFNTEVREFATTMIFNWKFSMSPVNLDVIDIDLNESPERVFDLVDAAMENGELSIVDDLSTQLFADGTGNASKDIGGLAIAVSQTGTYGGIARDTTAGSPGNAIRAGAEDTTGGALSLANVNVQFGNTVVGREKPDLLVTTQVLWNRFWERSQPSERNTPEDLRDIGFEAVRLNSAAVTVDSHCPTGFIYLLNTKHFILYVHRKWDMKFRGFMEPTNQQRMIGQLIHWCELVNRGPRFSGVMSGVT